MIPDFLVELKTPIYSGPVLRSGCVNRDGFIFYLGDIPSVYDTLIVSNPIDAKLWSPQPDRSSRTLEEHINLINKYQLEKVFVICNDLSFILQCPSIKEIQVHPSDDAGENFDYSPLYQMPNLRKVSLTMSCGLHEDYWYSVDYSKIKGLIDIGAAGKGHINYEKVPTLEKLWLSSNKKHVNLDGISCSKVLKEITLMSCKVQTLDGVGTYPQFESMNLYHNRALCDISALAGVSGSLKELTIESCPQIKDFSVLSSLENLEYLYLFGNNNLPNLDFLQNMKKLKVFNFTMNVEDGDLTNCLSIPCATCKNRKHYNLKDSQLPKTRPNR